MKRKKKVILMNRREFLLKTAAGCAAFGLGTLGFPAIVFPKTQMKVGYIPILDHLTLPVSHARDNNSFKNIDIEPKLFKRWDDVAGALQAGAIGAAFLLSNFAMDIFNKGADIKTILIGHRHGSGIAVRKDSKINSPSDLRGKTIATPARISTHTALLDTYLRGGGLSLSDVTTTPVAPPDMVKALEAGGIDAFIVAEPWVAKAVIERTGRLLILSKDIAPNHICCIVVVRNDVLKTNSEGIQEWIDSLIKSGRFIEKDKVDNRSRNVAPIASKYMGHSETVVTEALQNPNDRITYSDLNPRKADYQTILNMSLRAKLMTNVDLNSFIDSSFYQGSRQK
ncbi:MAG: hypothetical protein A2073_07680 [Deltaproteobacteria bacterium GWC2_42_11]|nr:MAG: hypothetical protein A2073_07680 [Deltaproteobacteria bacterium GWC2_42_11]HBO84420.1 hypothetical protein [Deltaproteobacteria bacterium]